MLDASINNFLNELKKRVYLKSKIVDGIEKPVGYDFETEVHDMVKKFLLAFQKPTTTSKVSESVQTPQQAKVQTPVKEPAQSVPVPSPVVQEKKIEAEEKKIETTPVPVSEKATPTTQTTSAPVAPEDFEKSAVEPNPPVAPGESKTVGELKKYCVDNKIPVYKPEEWYIEKFKAYGIDDRTFSGCKNFNLLHRKLLGGIDANSNFIRWQYAWLVYNHQNGKPLFQNTFVVDKSRINEANLANIQNLKTEATESTEKPVREKKKESPVKEVESKVSESDEEEIRKIKDLLALSETPEQTEKTEAPVSTPEKSDDEEIDYTARGNKKSVINFD